MVLQSSNQMLIVCVRAAMVPVPSSYQQSMAYADLHGGSLNPNDWFVIFIGKHGRPCAAAPTSMSISADQC